MKSIIRLNRSFLYQTELVGKLQTWLLLKSISRVAWTNAILLGCLFALMLMGGCKHNVTVKYGTITGNVNLVNDTGHAANDPTDFQDITIAIYHQAELDSTIVRINYEYPQIGVHLSQETDFDHRNQEVVKTTTTSADGVFTLSDVEEGTYNLAIFKEGWGVKYIYAVEVDKGETTTLAGLELNPAQTLPIYVASDFTFLTDHTYIVQATTNFVGSCVVEPGAMMFVQPNASIKFHGSFTGPELTNFSDCWKITSAQGLYSTQMDSLGSDDYFFSVEFRGSPVNLRGGVISCVTNTAAIINVDATIDHMMIRHCGGGISIQETEANLDNVIVADGTGIGIQISSFSASTANVTDSILYKMSDGVTVYIPGAYTISNCYFYGTQQAIRPDNCTGVITHNAFEYNRQDVVNYSASIPTQITYNDFFNTTFRNIFPKYKAVVNYNNFYKTAQYYIWIRQTNFAPTYSWVFADLDATNNYWGVSDIDQYLWDAGDNLDYPGEPCAHYIVYNPKRSTPVFNAGIQ